MYTRRPIFTCAFLFAGLGITGCVDEDLDGHELDLELVASPDEAEDPAVGIADELASENGATPYNYPVVECSSFNVIAVLDDVRGASCSLGESLPPNWAWHTMFDDFTPDLAAWTEPIPKGLQRYCIFEYVGPQEPNQEDYTQLFAIIDQYPHMSIDSAAQDCRGQRLQGTGLNDAAVMTELADAFHDAIDWIPGGVLAPTTPNRKYTEVAIVDTVSQDAHDDPFLDPVNEHGEFMGDIVSDIACADPSDPHCQDTIRYHVAMPREENEFADWYSGGEFGTMGDLSMSIVAAVGLWRQNRLADPNAPQRLVISASLGWVPEAPYNSDPNRGPVRALEAALHYAACNGAIVLAAAGNTTDAACGQGQLDPLAPATYEMVEAPGEKWCAEQGFIPIDELNFPVFGDPRPLVYAIGGLDGFDRPIPNARPKGMPALAAYAANTTVHTANGFTTPLTGTSVSTAVVAGIASLVWSYDPTIKPVELMHLIADASYETDLEADFDFTATHPRVRRASVCSALEYACANLSPGTCPQLSCQMAAPPADGHLGDYYAAIDDALNDPGNVVAQWDNDLGYDPVCVAPTWDEQIEPQPEHPMCPDCMLDTPPDLTPDNDMLNMSVMPMYQGLIVQAKLVTYNLVGTPTAFNLSDKAVGSLNDPTVAITQVALESPNAVSASLTFMLVDGSIQDGPITVR
jgi:hypothetical protein